MSKSSSPFSFRRIMRGCFSPSPTITRPEPEKFHPLDEIPKKCDVFVLHSDSFPVTSIASDLSSHLKKLGISVAFSGDESISTASVCILFLSKDFADSTDRLKELSKIHKCKSMDLIPIFFDVKPSEARKVDKGVFMEAFAKASKEEQYEEGWKEAFERTALLSGWKFSDFRGNARQLLKAVVQSVMKKVSSSSLQVAKYPVGLAEKTEKLERLLEVGVNFKMARVLGIVGMGGIGKTTLAKEFFRTTRNKFKAACFVEDVKGRVDKTGIESAQSLLLKDLLQLHHQIYSVNQGKYLLKKCLLRSEVIIVLDNIDDPNHLDALWVPEYIHQKSIILITTRNRKLLECIPNSLVYDMEGLETKYARELFCWHAFMMPYPALGFNMLVEGFVKYCNGLPLSLETLGGKLYEEEGPIWEETLKNVSESLPGDIEKHIRVSYDALDMSEKQIFLDIALFFIGEDMEMAVRIWQALGWYGSVGVQSLQQRCLINLENGQFKMHDQLRQMAVKIVDDENTENPGHRSRLWRPNDVMTVLSHESGSENVQAITLAAKQIQGERLNSSIVPKSEVVRNQNGGSSSSWSIRSFAPMTELRLLILEDACIEGDFRLLSKKIIWLRWRYFPSGPFPVGLPVQNLRFLDLSGGKMSSLWSDTQQIPVHLEELHLRGCTSLQRIPKSVKFLNGLEKLILSHCLGIVDIPDELCDIYSLKHVDLSGCCGLLSLPDRIGNWKHLQFLDISDCKKLECLPSSFGDLGKLEHLDLKWCSALSKLTSSFHKLVELRYLNLDLCMKLESVNDLTVGFSKLELLNTIMCKRFNLPQAVTFQRSLRTLKVSCLQFEVLPQYLGHLENLEELSLWQAYEVKTLDPFEFTKLSKLKDFTIGQFPLLDDLGISLGHLKQLKSITIALCGLSHLPDDIGLLQGLERLIILDCNKLAKLPATIKELSSLTTLSLTRCSRLQLDSEAFPNISNLQKLHLGNCRVADHFFQFVCEKGKSLKELKLEKMRLPEMKYIGAIPFNSASLSILSCTNIGYFEIFRGISSLKIEDCPGLKKIIVPDRNTSLQILDLSNCRNLVEICFIENLKSLKNLNINGCFDLHTVDGLEKLNRLSEFHMFLSDWYLLRSDNWLKKTLNTIKIPHATHLSAEVDLQKQPLNLPTGFEDIPRYSSTKFSFSTGRKSFCGVVICFVARHSLHPNMVRTSGEKDMFYKSISLRLVNGSNDTEICRYNIPDPSTFCHVSILMDDFLVTEMSDAGSELVISSVIEDLVSRAWIFLIPTNKKRLGGEVACSLMYNLKTHKESIRDFVERSELAKSKLEDEFEIVVINMDFRRIHALGVTNFLIRRTYTFNQIPIYVETIGEYIWQKHHQVLFWGFDRLAHLDLELSRSCRNLVEKPVLNHFEASVQIGNFTQSLRRTFRQLQFPAKGAFENYLSLDRIVSSHKVSPSRAFSFSE